VKVYNSLAVPLPLHGCEIWTLKQKNIRLKTAEMEFMRPTAGSSLMYHRKKGKYVIRT
jgi:hypothetical protein